MNNNYYQSLAHGKYFATGRAIRPIWWVPPPFPPPILSISPLSPPYLPHRSQVGVVSEPVAVSEVVASVWHLFPVFAGEAGDVAAETGEAEADFVFSDGEAEERGEEEVRRVLEDGLLLGDLAEAVFLEHLQV